MKFEVIGPDGLCKMWTTSIDCLPDMGEANVLLKAHHLFRLDGKRITTYNKLQEAVSNIHLKPVTPVSQPVKARKSIVCVDTGEKFNTQAEAARAMNVDPAAVSDSLKTGKRRAKLLFKFSEE